MKVYLVVHVYWDDFEIIAVYSTFDAASERATQENKNHYRRCTVEEWEVIGA